MASAASAVVEVAAAMMAAAAAAAQRRLSPSSSLKSGEGVRQHGEGRDEWRWRGGRSAVDEVATGSQAKRRPAMTGDKEATARNSRKF